MSTREDKVAKACLSSCKGNGSKLNMINEVKQFARIAKYNVLDEQMTNKLTSALDEALLPLNFVCAHQRMLDLLILV